MESIKKVCLCSFIMLSLLTGAPSFACPPTDVTLGPASDVTTWPPAPFRWRDIATNLYAASYRESYLYDDADVTLTYRPCLSGNFYGHLSATNLKPNFAYQIKLVGKPTGLWGDEGDDEANELIGFTGRWWQTQPTPGNSNDAEYNAHHLDPDYIFEGYLLFDFFVTDPDGSIEVDFGVWSSYHVLWWSHQRTPGACDSPILWSTVTGSAGDPAYDADVGPTEIGVYAEIERLCHGTTSLPLGTYNCRFLLTEESFHQSGDTQGYWASAMSNDDIHFEIGTATAVGQAEERTINLGENYPNPCNPLTVIPFELGEGQQVQLGIFSLRGELIKTLIDEVLPSGHHEAAWDGRDLRGQPAASGPYLYRLQGGGISQTRRLVLMK